MTKDNILGFFMTWYVWCLSLRHDQQNEVEKIYTQIPVMVGLPPCLHHWIIFTVPTFLTSRSWLLYSRKLGIKVPSNFSFPIANIYIFTARNPKLLSSGKAINRPQVVRYACIYIIIIYISVLYIDFHKLDYFSFKQMPIGAIHMLSLYDTPTTSRHAKEKCQIFVINILIP